MFCPLGRAPCRTHTKPGSSGRRWKRSGCNRPSHSSHNKWGNDHGRATGGNQGGLPRKCTFCVHLKSYWHVLPTGILPFLFLFFQMTNSQKSSKCDTKNSHFLSHLRIVADRMPLNLQILQCVFPTHWHVCCVPTNWSTDHTSILTTAPVNALTAKGLYPESKIAAGCQHLPLSPPSPLVFPWLW